MHTVICRKISSADLVVIPTLLYRYSIYESLSSPNHYLYYWLGYYDVRFSDNYPCSSRRKCRRWHLMLATFYNYLKAIDRNKWMQYDINLEFLPVITGLCSVVNTSIYLTPGGDFLFFPSDLLLGLTCYYGLITVGLGE